MRTDPEIERRQTMRNTEKHRKVTFVLPLPLLRIRTPEESTCMIMYFQKLKWIIEEALAAHRPISYSALFFETA
jgi:hypothetical protein